MKDRINERIRKWMNEPGSVYLMKQWLLHLFLVNPYICQYKKVILQCTLAARKTYTYTWSYKVSILTRRLYVVYDGIEHTQAIGSIHTLKVDRHVENLWWTIFYLFWPPFLKRRLFFSYKTNFIDFWYEIYTQFLCNSNHSYLSAVAPGQRSYTRVSGVTD